MSSRLGLRLVALLVPVVLLAPAAAHAEKVATTDPAGDVVSVGPTERGDDDLDNLLPAPENLTADVVRTVVDHTGSRLRVRIDLRELGRSRIYFAVLQVRTPAGTFEVEADDLGRRPEVEITRRGRAVDCPRLRAVGDRAAARAVITIPTSCLGAPRWVQVGAGIASLETVTAADGAEQDVVFADDAHRAGTIGDDNLTKGPKVRRG
ncbi:hypothetical protein ASG88_02435 [Nocardioides sp. Soil777]|uniref:hypothetical protein n=1 Tax=Nocardioides sp. Soil777 TaxID=1736409 RepID=UPI0007034829|nr:hypothetical protein [Nocardioides sp. Soil777]KRF07696.1 hypothetical protein ASG88_02435 [Nocardioides sp. Soil777]